MALSFFLLCSLEKVTEGKRFWFGIVESLQPSFALLQVVLRPSKRSNESSGRKTWNFLSVPYLIEKASTIDYMHHFKHESIRHRYLALSTNLTNNPLRTTGKDQLLDIVEVVHFNAI
jgi:hypothetical protein